MDPCFLGNFSSLDNYMFNYFSTFSLPHNDTVNSDKSIINLIKKYVNDNEENIDEICLEFKKKLIQVLDEIKSLRNAH